MGTQGANGIASSAGKHAIIEVPAARPRKREEPAGSAQLDQVDTQQVGEHHITKMAALASSFEAVKVPEPNV